MLIYFLIFPGLKIIRAGGAHWPARNHEKLQAVVLAMPPWVKEVNKNNTNLKKTKPNYCGGLSVVCKAQPGVLIFQPASGLKLPVVSADAWNAHDTLTSLNATVKKARGNAFRVWEKMCNA